MNDGILIEGCWTKNQIVVDYQPLNPVYNRTTNPIRERMIQATWSEFIKSNPTAYPGLAARYAGHKCQDDNLILHFGLTNYKDFIATNIMNPYLRDTEGDAGLSNACGVSIALLLKDEVVPFGLRASHLSECPNMWHTIGGNLNLQNPTDKPSPFDIAINETIEETGMNRLTIASMYCLGLTRNSTTWKPEFVFLFECGIASIDFVQGLKHAKDNDEHIDWMMVKADTNSLRDWANCHKITPACHGVIALLSRRLASVR